MTKITLITLNEAEKEYEAGRKLMIEQARKIFSNNPVDIEQTMSYYRFLDNYCNELKSLIDRMKAHNADEIYLS